MQLLINITHYNLITKEGNMRLSAPKEVVWIIAVILGVLGILGTYIAIPIASAHTFLLVAVGFVILALATLLKGL